MPSDTYKTTGNSADRPQKLNYYNEKTGTWVAFTVEDSQDESTPQTTDTVAEPSQTSKVDSKTAAQKEYIAVELNTLTGDLSLTSTEKSIRIKVNDTIKIVGIGKYLSGLYFVASIRRTLNKDGGYTHTLSLFKNGFGSSLKKAQEVTDTRKEEVAKTSPDIKVGDSVKIVGDAVYSNAHEGTKVPEWVKSKTLIVDALSSDGTKVRLNPIWSWISVKYVQKV